MANTFILRGSRGLTQKESASTKNGETTVTGYVETTLTSAQILALFTTPITVLPATTATRVMEVQDAFLVYNYGGTAYTIGSATNLQLKYTNAAGAAATTTLAVTGLLDQTATTSATLPKNTTAVVVPANAAVVLTLAGANPTLGNGTLTIKVTYTTHTVG